MIATIFALALVAWMAIPALAQDDAETGLYAGQITNVDDEAVDADVILLVSEEQYQEWWDEQEPPEESDFHLRFHTTDGDTFYVNGEPTDQEHFLCAAEENTGDNLFLADYDADGASEFAIFVEDDECPDDTNDEVEDHGEPQPVERAERVETGAGGTAPGGLGGLALLLGMITVAGATFLRKASETS